MQYTRLQLRTQARVAADQDNSTFPTDTAYNDIINRAADLVWRRMVAVGWKPSKAALQMDASLSNGSFPFPGPVATVDLVYPVTTITSVVPNGPPLHRVKIEDIPGLLSQGSGDFGKQGTQAVAYDLHAGSTSVGGNASLLISLYPPPTSGFYIAYYTPQFSGFTADGDTWLGPEGSGELIILTAAMEGARKEGDPGELLSILGSQLKERFDEVVQFGGFMQNEPQTIHDVRRRPSRPGDWGIDTNWDYL